MSHVAPNDKDRFSDAQIQNLKNLINEYDVDYYINGHNHNPASGKFGDAKHITVGASSKRSILELKISNFVIEHAFINL